MQLVFATNNKNKIYEVSRLISGRITLLSLHDIGCTEELPETQPTLEANALQKARYVFEHYGKSCFADDTGLEIEALGGRPGVFSARYAGEGKNADDNISKVLDEMKDIPGRKAKFKTVIALILDGKQYLFDGSVEGTILAHRRGEGGFGYDPVFVPAGQTKSFAEMSAGEKNKISHRAKAIKKLVEFLNRMRDSRGI